MRWMTLTGALTLALDQLTKLWVVHLLDLKTKAAIDVVPPFLNFRMAWNQGVNFGLGSSDGNAMRWVLIGVALAISALVIVWVRRDRMGWLAQVSAGLLVGGAVGNVIDRLAYGAVADFLNMSCCGWHNPWSFNVADIGVFAGAVGLALFAGGKSDQETP
jgi:signal peptidase II